MRVDKKKKINFILPYKAKRPAGGFRIMYEYANRLSLKGYSVHLYYPIKTPLMNYRIPTPLRFLLSKIEGFGRHRWFNFDQSITMSYIPWVNDKYIRNADIVIATWWTTATEMGTLATSKGLKINLIQGYENWEGHEDLLFKSYDMQNTTNVVVATYLKDIVERHTTQKAVLITNAIDDQVYHIQIPIRDRKKTSVCMLYSGQEIKGSKYGLAALRLVKEKYQDLEVDLFGTYSKPDNLPSWVTYHHDPANLAKVYNENAIFISNSLTEGMALTPLEAMFCGCAVVCTAIDGHKEYAFDGDTAILVEPKNVEMLFGKICFFD